MKAKIPKMMLIVLSEESGDRVVRSIVAILAEERCQYLYNITQPRHYGPQFRQRCCETDNHISIKTNSDYSFELRTLEKVWFEGELATS
jgi:hypothetical protein